jgi:hypothetical protein
VTVRSIIDVGVRGQEFDSFLVKYQKYQDQLSKSPGLFKVISKEQSEIAKNFQAMTAALMAQNELKREQAAQDKEHTRQTSKISEFWGSMSRDSTTVFRNVLGIGHNLLKWGSLIGGLATGASLFGIDRMAASVSGQRQAAMGLGLSIGQMRALQINMKPLGIDPESFLGGVNTAVTDLSKQGGLRALGVNPNGSTADVSEQLLRAVRRIALTTPTNQLGFRVQQYGLDQFGIGVNQLQIEKQLSAEEFNKRLAGMRGDVGPLGISGAAARAWTDFTTNLEKIGGGLFATFAKGLVNLASPLTKLGTSVEHLIAGAMKPGGALEQGVDKLALWLDHLGDQMGSEKFRKGFDDLIDELGTAGSALANFAQVLPDLADLIHFIAHPFQTTGNAIGGGLYNFFHPSAEVNAGNVDAYKEQIKWFARTRGLPEDLLLYQFQHESGGRLDPRDSATGDVGPFQIHGGPRDPMENLKAAVGIDVELARRYKNDWRKVIAAYNLRESTRQSDIDAYPNDWFARIPSSTQQYVRGAPASLAGANVNVNVTFNKVPGGYVPTVGAQIAGQ